MNRSDLKRAMDKYKRDGDEIRKLTADSLLLETPEQQQARIAHLLNPKNYNEFFCYYFGGSSKYRLADSPCASFHVAMTVELCQNPVITQFREIFRGGAKSIHTNTGNTFLLNKLHELKFGVIVGSNEDRAILLLSELQLHLEYNERILKDFGEQLSYGYWNKGEFETTDGAYFMALGIDQPFRGLRRYGNRVDFASVDDVEDRQVANNPRRVQQRGEKILSDLGEAFGKDRKRLVVANNYITHTGILNYLHQKIGDNAYTKIWRINFLDKQGKPTWHERYSQAEALQKQQSTDYYTWQRELMNNPIEEGKLFKQEWIQYSKIPSLADMDNLVVYGDLSYKETGDYKAMVLLGKKGRNFYLIDCFVAQTTRQECATWLYDVYEELHLEDFSVNYLIEGLFAQDEFVNDFDMEGDMRGYYIPMLADKKNKENKYMRIESMLGFWQRGNIFINEKIKTNTHLKNFLNQLLAFEKGSTAHDDAPDAFQSALAELNRISFADNWESVRVNDVFKSKIHEF